MVDTPAIRHGERWEQAIPRSNLAEAYRAAGRLDEAIALDEPIFADRRRMLGPDHPAP